jgi:hypothetical protein
MEKHLLPIPNTSQKPQRTNSKTLQKQEIKGLGNFSKNFCHF